MGLWMHLFSKVGSTSMFIINPHPHWLPCIVIFIFFFQVILHFLWDEKLESINSGSHLAMYIYQSLSAIVDSPSYENGKIINFIIIYHNPWSHIHHIIKLQQNSILITVPTHEQITNIIIKLNPCKAPGLDGLNN